MAEETVLLSIKIEGTENEAKINGITTAITNLQAENKKLAETNKELAKSQGDNSEQIAKNTSQIEANKQVIAQGTATRKGLIQTIIAEDNSIKALSVRNADLVRQRNLLNTSTEEGRKKIQTLNSQIDANNKVIKDNSDALGKQKINIGNYSSALDGIAPGLGGFVNGIQSATTAGKAFIATPIGAVLAAVGLALGTVIKFFKGSEEGQDALAKVTQRLSFVFEQLGQVVEVVGEAIFKAISFVGDLAFSVLESVAPAAATALKVAMDAADQITALEDEIDARENEMIVRRAQTNKQVQELREKAIKQEGDAKRKTIQEAIDLEKQLSAEETFQAQERLKLLELQVNARGKATEEEKKQIAELNAAVINAQAEAASSTIRFQKELEKLKDEEAKQNEKLAEQRAIEIEQKLNLEQVNARLSEQADKEITIDIPAKISGNDTMNAALDNLVKKNEATTKTEQNKGKASQDASKKQVEAAIALSAAVIGLGKSESAAGKALALTTIAVNSAIGVSNAVKAGSGRVWPANLVAILSGITAVLAGITQAKGFLGKAAGGGDWITAGPQLLLVGDNPGGRERVTVEPLSGRGETVVGKNMIAMAGGGSLIAGGEIREASRLAVQSNQLSSIQTILVLQDFEAASMAKNQPIAQAQVL